MTKPAFRAPISQSGLLSWVGPGGPRIIVARIVFRRSAGHGNIVWPKLGCRRDRGGTARAVAGTPVARRRAAAEQNGRLCCGMELDPKYVDLIVERWQRLSGKAACLEEDGRSFAEMAAARRTRR